MNGDLKILEEVRISHSLKNLAVNHKQHNQYTDTINPQTGTENHPHPSPPPLLLDEQVFAASSASDL